MCSCTHGFKFVTRSLLWIAWSLGESSSCPKPDWYTKWCPKWNNVISKSMKNPVFMYQHREALKMKLWVFNKLCKLSYPSAILKLANLFDKASHDFIFSQIFAIGLKSKKIFSSVDFRRLLDDSYFFSKKVFFWKILSPILFLHFGPAFVKNPIKLLPSVIGLIKK